MSYIQSSIAAAGQAEAQKELTLPENLAQSMLTPPGVRHSALSLTRSTSQIWRLLHLLLPWLNLFQNNLNSISAWTAGYNFHAGSAAAGIPRLSVTNAGDQV